MESMQNERIDVFISSRCGDEHVELSIIRKGLQHALEETGLFKVYLFEKASPSSEHVKRSYLRFLERADVCLFLIDNERLTSESGEGVLEELRTVKNRDIRAIYIFEKPNDGSKNPNIDLLQVDNHFVEFSIDDVIFGGYRALIDEIIMCYKSDTYALSREIPIGDGNDDGDKNTVKKEVGIQSFIPEKSLIHYNKHELTQNTILSFLQGVPIEMVEPDENNFDSVVSNFLMDVFEVKSDINYAIIKTSILNSHSLEDREFISKRFDAIQLIYSEGKMAKAYETLSKLYDECKIQDSIPEWVKKDLLIDLRSLKRFTDDTLVFKSEWQEALDNYSSPLFYPVIDRQARDLYQNLVKEDFEKYIKDFGTTRFGSWKNLFGNHLSEYVTIALFNCSYVHIEEFKRMLFQSLWKEFEKSEDAIEFLITIYKLLILSNNVSSFEQINKKYRFHISNLEQNRIAEIFDFALTIKGSENSADWFFRIFAAFGLFLNNASFEKYMAEFDEIVKDMSSYSVNEALLVLMVFSENSNRINFSRFDTLAQMYIENFKHWQIYERILKCILEFDLSALSLLEQNSIIKMLKFFSEHSDKSLTGIHILNIILSLEEIDDEGLDDINEIINHLDEVNKKLYQEQHLLDSSEGMEKLIRAYISESLKRNEKYGANNSWPGYSTYPYTSILYVLRKGQGTIKRELVFEILRVGFIVLDNPKQPYAEKVGVLDVIMFIIERYPEFQQEIKSKEIASGGFALLDGNIQRIEYEITQAFLESYFLKNASALRDYFAENKLDDIDKRIAISKRFVDFFSLVAIEHVDPSLVTFIIDFFTFSYQIDKKYLPVYATNFFISLLKNVEYQKLAANMLMKICYSGNSLVRIRILRVFQEIKAIDASKASSIYEYLKGDQYFEIHNILAGLES